MTPPPSNRTSAISASDMNSPSRSQCVSTTLYSRRNVGVSRWLTRTERDGTISVAPAPLSPFGRATGSSLPRNFSGTADRKQVRGFLVSRPMNTMTFADGACEGRSRNEEEAMQGHRRRRETQRSPAIPISPKGGGGTASICLSLLLHDAHWHRVVVASRTRRRRARHKRHGIHGTRH